MPFEAAERTLLSLALTLYLRALLLARRSELVDFAEACRSRAGARRAYAARTACRTGFLHAPLPVKELDHADALLKRAEALLKQSKRARGGSEESSPGGRLSARDLLGALVGEPAR